MTGLASSTKPTFGTLAWRRGERHIVVVDDDGMPAATRLLAAIPAAGVSRVDVLLMTSTGMSANQAEPEIDLRLTIFKDEQSLITALGKILSGASMTTQLYLAGAESLILEATRCGLAFGLRPEAIVTELRGTIRRHAQCAHCKTVYRDIPHRVFVCARCNLTLIVRDHYSRRIGAYQAVMIDPSNPRLPALLSESFE